MAYTNKRDFNLQVSGSDSSCCRQRWHTKKGDFSLQRIKGTLAEQGDSYRRQDGASSGGEAVLLAATRGEKEAAMTLKLETTLQSGDDRRRHLLLSSGSDARWWSTTRGGYGEERGCWF
ncbi:hypothetical protein Q3G72_000508 [Acer saccharum]|nr:hypothetical protein Q3G72_000508 [Acer saccharum]